jgi:hypothetical protein
LAEVNGNNACRNYGESDVLQVSKTADVSLKNALSVKSEEFRGEEKSIAGRLPGITGKSQY